MNPKIRNLLRKVYFYIRKNTPADCLKWIKRLLRINSDAWSHNRDIAQNSSLRARYGLAHLKNVKLHNNICLFIDERNRNLQNFIQAKDDFFGVIDIRDPLSASWLTEELVSKYDGFMFVVSHGSSVIRTAFNERMSLLYGLNAVVWPTLFENYMYEGKRRSFYYFKAMGIPHPSTNVFYHESEARAFADKATYPLVMKSDQGASSSGVVILDNVNHAHSMIDIFFDGTYLRWGADPRDRDWGYIIFQEFIPNVREYRIIKIGDFWFGHEKKRNVKGLYHSGSGVNSWDVPSFKVFDFCKDLAERHSINVMCMDIFEDENGCLLVNELQTWFGSYNPSQMYLDGVPGTYINTKGGWVFKEGLYNINGGANLRLIEFDKHICGQKILKG